MSITDILREFLYPARNRTVLLSAAFIFLMLEFAAFGRIFGLFLAFLILPSLFHYLMRILDARSRGVEPGPLESDDLLWYHQPWSLFMIVHIVLVGYAIYFAGDTFGASGAWIATILLTGVLPASLAVLAITKSPLESFNPQAIGALITRTGGNYWVLPTFLVATGLIVYWAQDLGLYSFFVEMIGFYLTLVFFSLAGAVVAPHDLHEEVEIYEPVEKSQAIVDEELLAERTSVLNHAYGFISRDNRAGGFKHIESWLHRDPDPATAWHWFFEQMLRWEMTTPALLFAQSYLHVLLEDGDHVAAVKVMLRCRHENPDFIPLRDDLESAIDAAERCQNQELAALLRSRV